MKLIEDSDFIATRKKRNDANRELKFSLRNDEIENDVCETIIGKVFFLPSLTFYSVQLGAAKKSHWRLRS